MPILDEEGNVKDEEDCKRDCLQLNYVPGPGGKHVQQSGNASGFMGNEKIVAADGKVEKEDGNHVDVCPDKNPLEGLQGGAESFHYGHINGNIN